MRRALLVSLLAAGAVASWVAGRAVLRQPHPAAGPQARPVRVATVERLDQASWLRFPAVLRAERRAVIAFEVSARLVARPVQPGERVGAGDLLARIDPSALASAEAAARAALAEHQARLGQQRRSWRRMERLVAAGTAPEEELDLAAAAVEALTAATEVAAADLAEAERQLAQTELRAPFDGTVVAAHAETGEAVASGAPVVEIAGEGRLETEILVPEPFLGSLAPGQQVAVEATAGGPSAAGVVRTVAQAARSGLYPVVVSVAGRGAFLPGSSVEVSLPRPPSGEVTVPLAAVVDPGGSRPFVFRLESGRARLVSVEIGDLSGERVAVGGDLSVGDEVLVTGHTSILDGDPIEVLR